MIEIKFWGVRGSMPAPGPQYTQYGGNTSCIQIKIDKQHEFIIDAGTGIVQLGEKLKLFDQPIYIFFTHFHWDHIQGIPFFKPLYMPNQEIHCIADQSAGWEKYAFSQMQDQNYPVLPEVLKSKRVFHQFKGFDHFKKRGIHIETLQSNHPGGFTIYKVTQNNKTICCCSDNELSMKKIKTTSRLELIDFFKGSDVLIHDAQYLPEEINQKIGWGHSHYQEVCELAAAAKIKQLILTHHDPQRTDQDMDKIKSQIFFYLKKKKYPLSVTCAYEGLSIYI